MILHEMIDYGTLRLIWWGLLGFLLIAFAVMDGFDLGVGALLPFIARGDAERRAVLETIGPVWEGNQVWLIVAGGATFAAWPQLYAVAFSGFYLALFAVVLALILRPVAFKYRNDRDGRRWRAGWDWAQFVAGAVPALIFGVAMGNLLLGADFRLAGADLRITYAGTTLVELLHPFALFCGLVSLAMILMHGAAWLAFKLDGDLARRARRICAVAGVVTLVLFALGGVWLWLGIPGFRITSPVVTDAASDPLTKTVEMATGLWLRNYGLHPWLWLWPVLGLAGAGAAALLAARGAERLTLLMSGLAITGIIASVGTAMFPFLLPSRLDPASGLTVWDASSTHLTLFVMLVVGVIFIPLIMVYTAWVYHVLRGKVDIGAIIRGDGGY